MLFKKKQEVPVKRYFTICYGLKGREVYLTKLQTDTQYDAAPFAPTIIKPEITICYQAETSTELANVTTCFGDTRVVMQAPQFSYETKLLGMEFVGYDQDDRLVVSYHEGNSCINVAPDGMQNLFDGEQFMYHCSAEKITFTSKNQTVMELYPQFIPNTAGAMQIKGWIYESHLCYLPYLIGFQEYSYLE